MPTPTVPFAASTAPRAASPNVARAAGHDANGGFDLMVREAETNDAGAAAHSAKSQPARESARHSGGFKAGGSMNADAAEPSDAETTDIAVPVDGGPATDGSAASGLAPMLQSPDQTPSPKGDAVDASSDATVSAQGDAPVTAETITAEAVVANPVVVDPAIANPVITASDPAVTDTAQGAPPAPAAPVETHAEAEAASSAQMIAAQTAASQAAASQAATDPSAQAAAKGLNPAVTAQTASQATSAQAALDAEVDASAEAQSSPPSPDATETLEAAALAAPKTAAASNAASSNAPPSNAPPSNAMGAEGKADGSSRTSKGEQKAETASVANQTAASAPTGAASPTPAASAAAARSPTPAAVLAQLLDAAPSADAPAPAAGQPAATTTAAAPAIAVTAAGQSGLSQVNAQTIVHLAAQITKRLEGRSTQFDMSMTPEGLGRVDVSLDIDAEGRLAARLAFDNPLAATDMKGRADELRRQLEDAGFTLAQDALDFSQRDGSAPGGGFDRRQSRAFANASRTALDADIAAPASAWMSLTLTPQGVDMKV